MGASEDLDRANADWCKAVSNQDVEGVLDAYTDDAKFLAPGAPLAQGRAQLAPIFEAMFAAGVKSIDLRRAELIEAGNVVIEVGTGTMNVQAPNGDMAAMDGKYISVSRYQADGSLKMVADIYNMDVEPTA